MFLLRWKDLLLMDAQAGMLWEPQKNTVLWVEYRGKCDDHTRVRSKGVGEGMDRNAAYSIFVDFLYGGQ